MKKCNVCGAPRGEGFRIVVAAPDVAPDGRFPAGNELLCRMCYFWALEIIQGVISIRLSARMVD